MLANIALHGMENALGIRYLSNGENRGTRAFVRYADDFVVYCESRQDAEKCQELLGKWLAQRGLQFSEEKTRIVSLFEGYDFLGFHVRLYPSSVSRWGHKLLIKPSNTVSRMG